MSYSNTVPESLTGVRSAGPAPEAGEIGRAYV